MKRRTSGKIRDRRCARRPPADVAASGIIVAPFREEQLSDSVDMDQREPRSGLRSYTMRHCWSPTHPIFFLGSRKVEER
jgi:hypothetical protein